MPPHEWRDRWRAPSELRPRFVLTLHHEEDDLAVLGIHGVKDSVQCRNIHLSGRVELEEGACDEAHIRAAANVRFARLSERRLPQTSNKLMLVYFAAVTLCQQLATCRHKRAAPLWKPRRRHAGLWSLTNARDKRGPPRRSVGNAGRAERNFARRLGAVRRAVLARETCYFGISIFVQVIR